MLKNLTEPHKRHFCVVSIFSPPSTALGRRETIFIRNPARSNWNLRIQITPYDQEHLLSSQAQQGRGKSHHSRSEKWISSKCGVASTLVGTETEQDQQILFCLFAFLLAFLLKESAVFMCACACVSVCTQNYAKRIPAWYVEESIRVKKSNQCQFIIVKSTCHNVLTENVSP